MGCCWLPLAAEADEMCIRDRIKRAEENGNSEWTVVLQRVPHIRTAPLDRDSLKDALERAMLPLP